MLLKALFVLLHITEMSLTGEVRSLGEQQKLHRFSDVAEILQHVGHVSTVVFPATMDKDEGGHLHRPTCTHTSHLAFFYDLLCDVFFAF